MTDILVEQVDNQAPPPGPGPPPSKQPDDSNKQHKPATDTTKLPKGYVLDKDGKPCRTCNSLLDFRKAKGFTGLAAAKPVPSDCPPDVNEIGRSTWTLLHSVAAQYPEAATGSQQDDMIQFLGIFSKIYPCWHCADDFRIWLNKPENKPQVSGREVFGKWLCGAHNEVNKKLGKPVFDCDLWKERWKDGWKDGRCD
ncbi:ERV/ALR sulfhydryl oxidase domain-containing protein [Lipomyces japonicus]|uniref:ERV/ALR sulfhydryl oxidase domain-containing protein n=1 Tax=Lipomyces japonicus TaxID=56871 RepID=UPI0034CD6087